MSKVIIKPKSHDEWLQYRTNGIGSSEVATIIGANPYETPYELWRRKRGLDGPKESNDAMLMGHLLEPAVADRWQIETGNKVIKSSAGDWLVYDEQYPYMQVSPDRLYWGKTRNLADRGILECKTTQMRFTDDCVPKYWLCQLQYQLGVMGLKHGALAWLVMGRDFHHREFEFDTDIFEALKQQVTTFWHENIIGGKQPEAKSSTDVLKMFDRHTEGKAIEATPEITEEVMQLKLYKEQIKELEEKASECEERVKLAMMDAEVLNFGGTPIATWRTSRTTSKPDVKSLLAELPQELIERHTIEVPGTRRFLVK